MTTAPIGKLEDFVSEILGRTTSVTQLVTYRGHGNSAFKLQPSIFRTAVNRENEHILLRELVAAHPEDFSADTSALELLVRMQHYSLPTRVLDVSLNPTRRTLFRLRTDQEARSGDSCRQARPAQRRGGRRGRHPVGIQAASALFRQRHRQHPGEPGTPAVGFAKEDRHWP